jgi:hypothetical protein
MAEPPRPSEPDSPAADAQASLARARAKGRRVAFAIFYVVAFSVSVAGGLQVFLQAFQRHEAPELHITTCAEGLSRLSAAVERARKAASATDGEDAALADFRNALRPEWDDRDHIEDLCRPAPSSMAALDAIEQLRYAEEHAVRREAAELAPLRRRVQAIAPRGESRPEPAPQPPSATAPTEPRNP